MTQAFPVTFCAYCGRAPEQIFEYAQAAAEEQMTPREYVAREEGTLNTENGHFACTECYIKIGMPTAPNGWRAP